MMIHEECNAAISVMLEDYYGVSSVEELKNTYCVIEDLSGQPILWRMIGVMNNVDDGTGKKESRIKIIRDESIGVYSWDMNSDVSYDNDWTTSTLAELLNSGAYYNRTTGIYYNGAGPDVVSLDFTSTGLTSEAKSMIGDAVWNLGETRSWYLLSSEFYDAERSNQQYEAIRPTVWTGRIGLMYPSDYGYATSGGSNLNRNECLNMGIYYWHHNSSSNYPDCYNNDWLYKNSNGQWSISPIDEHNVFLFNENGAFAPYVFAYYDVFPSAFLNSSVKIVDGDGTRENPFVLSGNYQGSPIICD